MSEQEPVDRFEGLEAASVVDPDLLAPEELADRLILWGSRARQVLAERQQLLVVIEGELQRLGAEREVAEAPAEHELLEPLREEMRRGFDEYLQALQWLLEALQTDDPALLEQALEHGEGAETRLRHLDVAHAETQEGVSALREATEAAVPPQE
jgi:hypothetical protein